MGILTEKEMFYRAAERAFYRNPFSDLLIVSLETLNRDDDEWKGLGLPVLLVSAGGEVPEATRREIARRKNANLYVWGGRNDIPGRAMDDLETLTRGKIFLITGYAAEKGTAGDVIGDAAGDDGDAAVSGDVTGDPAGTDAGNSPGGASGEKVNEVMTSLIEDDQPSTTGPAGETPAGSTQATGEPPQISLEATWGEPSPTSQSNTAPEMASGQETETAPLPGVFSGDAPDPLDNSDVPGTPEAAGTPDPHGTPDTMDTTGTTDTLETSGVPDTPEALDTPDTINVPDTVITSDVPDTTDAPGAPESEGLPEPEHKAGDLAIIALEDQHAEKDVAANPPAAEPGEEEGADGQNYIVLTEPAEFIGDKPHEKRVGELPPTDALFQEIIDLQEAAGTSGGKGALLAEQSRKVTGQPTKQPLQKIDSQNPEIPGAGNKSLAGPPGKEPGTEEKSADSIIEGKEQERHQDTAPLSKPDKQATQEQSQANNKDAGKKILVWRFPL